VQALLEHTQAVNRRLDQLEGMLQKQAEESAGSQGASSTPPPTTQLNQAATQVALPTMTVRELHDAWYFGSQLTDGKALFKLPSFSFANPRDLTPARAVIKAIDDRLPAGGAVYRACTNLTQRDADFSVALRSLARDLAVPAAAAKNTELAAVESAMLQLLNHNKYTSVYSNQMKNLPKGPDFKPRAKKARTG
jgi:hypothetical protein